MPENNMPMTLPAIFMQCFTQTFATLRRDCMVYFGFMIIPMIIHWWFFPVSDFFGIDSVHRFRFYSVLWSIVMAFFSCCTIFAVSASLQGYKPTCTGAMRLSFSQPKVYGFALLFCLLSFVMLPSYARFVLVPFVVACLVGEKSILSLGSYLFIYAMLCIFIFISQEVVKYFFGFLIALIGKFFLIKDFVSLSRSVLYSMLFVFFIAFTTRLHMFREK